MMKKDSILESQTLVSWSVILHTESVPLFTTLFFHFSSLLFHPSVSRFSWQSLDNQRLWDSSRCRRRWFIFPISYWIEESDAFFCFISPVLCYGMKQDRWANRRTGEGERMNKIRDRRIDACYFRFSPDPILRFLTSSFFSFSIPSLLLVSCSSGV